MGTTILAREPSTYTQQQGQNPQREHPKQGGKDLTWKEFFRMREERNQKRLQFESSADLQKRCNRERDPPTISAKVFEWLPSIDDPGRLVREPVTAKNRFDVLSSYESAHKRYDSLNNEWDCCEEFAPASGIEEDMEDVVTFTGIAIDPLNCLLEEPSVPSTFGTEPPSTLTNAPSPQTTGSTPQAPAIYVPNESLNLDLTRAYTCEPLETLGDHYGFVSPLPLPTAHVTEAFTEQKKFKFLHLLGLVSCEDTFLNMRIAGMAWQFLDKLMKGRRPEQGRWDLDNKNRVAVASSRRINYLRVVNDSFFIFDFKQHTTVNWKLGVTTASDALFVCRLNSGFDEYDIARRLLQSGIPFCTLRRMGTVPRPVQSPGRMLPFRLSGYNFTTRDYDAYQHECTAILALPRARAALLRGGILWRIAVDILSFDDVLRGPSTTTTIDGNGFAVHDARIGEVFGDDDLTDTEVELLCGAYVCYTGKYQLVFGPSYCKFHLHRKRESDCHKVVVSYPKDLGILWREPWPLDDNQRGILPKKNNGYRRRSPTAGL
jgi:hypothetical protein